MRILTTHRVNTLTAADLMPGVGYTLGTLARIAVTAAGNAYRSYVPVTYRKHRHVQRNVSTLGA